MNQVHIKDLETDQPWVNELPESQRRCVAETLNQLKEFYRKAANWLVGAEVQCFGMGMNYKDLLELQRAVFVDWKVSMPDTPDGRGTLVFLIKDEFRPRQARLDDPPTTRIPKKSAVMEAVTA